MNETQKVLLGWFKLLCKGEIVKIEVELVESGYVVMSAKYKKVIK